MPTDVTIQYLACTLDEEQDPQVWTCNWRLTDPAGTVLNATTSALVTEDMGEHINDLDELYDYQLV